MLLQYRTQKNRLTDRIFLCDQPYFTSTFTSHSGKSWQYKIQNHRPFGNSSLPQISIQWDVSWADYNYQIPLKLLLVINFLIFVVLIFNTTRRIATRARPRPPNQGKVKKQKLEKWKMGRGNRENWTSLLTLACIDAQFI